jgi:hypothetical protein
MFAYRLKALDTTTVYPLLLYLAEQRRQIDDEEFDGLITDVESYLVRRLICELTPKAYNRTFLSILSALKAAGVAPTRTAVQEQLLKLSGPSGVWPSDEDFGKAWVSIPAYKRLRQARTRMILEALELRQHGPKQERRPFKDPTIDPLQIEHVFPQAADPEDWPEFFAPELDPAIRDRLLHGFGNLTLLNDVLNPSVSNGAFSRKRPEIALQSTLRLNAYFQKFKDADRWAQPEIEARAVSLLATAVECWPHPGSAPKE